MKIKVKSLPSSPGVYIMKDSLGTIIYVGKAKNLKRRVQSYFYHAKSHSSKIVKMIHNLNDFEYILTDTEFEAFLLECKLIKEWQPYFNRKMKNPRAYSYIAIQKNGKLPAIVITANQNKNDDTIYFGPYINKHTVEKAILGLMEFGKILCSATKINNAPCLNYSLGLCLGICLGESKLEEYREVVNKIIVLLNGKDIGLLEEMKQKMEKAAENLEFELASRYRDYIDSIFALIYKERVIDFTNKNKNIVIIEELDNSTFKLFLVNRNQVLYSKKYSLEHSNIKELCSSIKSKMITYLKDDLPDSAFKVSKDDIDKAQIIYRYLQSNCCQYWIVQESWLKSDNLEMESILKGFFDMTR